MDLERLSFINLVNFYKRELTQLTNGEEIAKVFPRRASRKPLYRYGVLRKNTARVTDEALQVLEESAALLRRLAIAEES